MDTDQCPSSDNFSPIDLLKIECLIDDMNRMWRDIYILYTLRSNEVAYNKDLDYSRLVQNIESDE